MCFLFNIIVYQLYFIREPNLELEDHHQLLSLNVDYQVIELVNICLHLSC
jgi:acetamidase/formamidase